MDWTEAVIYTTSEGADVVCGCLIGLNITGFVIKDSKTLDEFLDNKLSNWDYIDDDLMGLKDCETSVTIYLPINVQGAELLTLVKDELSALKSRDTKGAFGRLEIELKSVSEDDWANNWKQYFKPLEIGNKLLIKPSWEEIPTADNDRVVVEIDPASSFGTGQHNTTQLCLENIENYISQDDKVLDLGCGSGILSIACLLLGAKSVTLVDIDENSVKIAGENLLKNNISEKSFNAYCGNIIDDEALRAKIGDGYDFICANIVSDILIAMSPYFAKFLKSGKTLVVSGVISERKQEVMGIIEKCGFALVNVKEKEGWVSAVFTKL